MLRCSKYFYLAGDGVRALAARGLGVQLGDEAGGGEHGHLAHGDGPGGAAEGDPVLVLHIPVEGQEPVHLTQGVTSLDLQTRVR